MHLYATLFPPLPVRQAVDAIVRSVVVLAPPAPPIVRNRSFLGRRGRRSDAPEAHLPVPNLDVVPVDQMSISLAIFGMVTRPDQARLIRALTDGLTVPGPLEVRLKGACVIELPEDKAVWAKLDGDLDGLARVATSVTQSVEKLGFFVDRRLFRPLLRIGTITENTSEDYLGAVLAALDAYQSDPWPLEAVSLMKQSFRADGPVSEEVHTIDVQRPHMG